MTTTTNSFVAIGPAQIGFEANWPRNAFKFGALAVGGYAGVYGAIADLALPPANTIWDPAGVVGTSNNQHGVFGISWTRCGVMGQWGLKPAVVQSMWPPPRAGVMGLAQDTDGVVGWSDHGTGVRQILLGRRHFRGVDVRFGRRSYHVPRRRGDPRPNHRRDWRRRDRHGCE
jgi:hypothetical protein